MKTNHALGVVLAGALGTAASAALAQQAPVTLYGLVDANVQSIRTSGAGYTAAERGTKTAVDSNGMTTSHWGMRGTEDLGGGLRAVFALEGFFRPDTGEAGRFGSTDLLFKRNAYVGLEGGFGRVTAGRHTTQYFVSTVITNPFGDSFGYSPMILHTFGTSLGTGLGINDARTSFIRNDSGWSNAVAYTSPNLGGLTAAAMYSTASGSNDQEDPVHTSRGKAYSGQLVYRSGPLVATAVYQDININGIDQKQKAWLLGGAYDLQIVRLFAQLQDIRSTLTAGKDRDSSWQLGATVPFGSHSLRASYARTKTDDESGTAADKTRKTWAVGYGYDFSRRTDVYANYLSDELDAAAGKKRTVFGVGLRHRF